MSIRPRRSTVVSTSAWAEVGEAMSLVSATAMPPASAISVATAAAGPVSRPEPALDVPRSLTTTDAPRSASSSA
jgi:hypothetical protein